MLLIKYIPIFLALFFATAVLATSKKDVLVCYGKLNPEDISGYKYVIIESEYYTKSDVNLIKQYNDTVLCYISLGEVNEKAKYYHHFKYLVSHKNEIWNSYYLNLKSIETKSALKSIISKMLDKGFDGLFLDNIDNFGSYGKQFTQRQELVVFLKELRIIYPSHFFMQNSGLELIDDTHNLINAISFESVASNYSFKTNTYGMRNNKDYRTYVKKITTCQQTYKLPIILIEYASDYNLYRKIKTRVKHTSWSYFIGEIDLQNITHYSEK